MKKEIEDWLEFSPMLLQAACSLTVHCKEPLFQLSASGFGPSAFVEGKQLVPVQRHFLPWLKLCISQNPELPSLLGGHVKNPKPVTWHTDLIT